MSMMKRRHFLQFAGSTLATLGLSEFDIINQGNRYAQVLAQSTPRKLALLVGINKYPSDRRNLTNLRGCITDVQLQEELLVHRFGFNRNDIVKLIDTADSPPEYQPTRKNILEKFEKHLIEQAKPGDVVVFHFSGHGSFLPDPNPIAKCTDRKSDDQSNSTFVVADQLQNNYAPDIMGRTLFLLRLALKTDNVTMVLDSCHSGGGTRGNFIVRSGNNEGLQPHPEEIKYQNHWIEKLGLTEAKLQQLRCQGVGKGVVIAAAEKEEEAADARFDGFDAGAFTYLMTQYLWQQKDTIGRTIAEVENNIIPLSLQHPKVDGNNLQPIYFISGQSTPSSDAVISKINGETMTLWLGGIEYDSLAAFSQGATFALINERGQASGKLELTSPHDGLVAKAKLVEKGDNITIKPGTLLQESSRVIPADLKLRIGLDISLAKEVSIAQTALSRINRIEAVPAQRGDTPYPGEVEYILGRMTKDNRLKQKEINNIPTIGCIGLFTKGLHFIPQSFGKPGETIKDAVSRLEGKLKSLLATLIIKKTLNANSSELDVEVAINLVNQPNKILARTATLRSKNNRGKSAQVYPNRLPLNKYFQFQITNNSSENLYIAILIVEKSGGLFVAFPQRKNISDDKLLVEPKENLLVGKSIAVEKGPAEAVIIASRSPLKKAVKALQTLAQEQNRDSDPIDINREPVMVINDLLDDLSVDRGGVIVEPAKVKAADIATLSISFEVG